MSGAALQGTQEAERERLDRLEAQGDLRFFQLQESHFKLQLLLIRCAVIIIVALIIAIGLLSLGKLSAQRAACQIEGAPDPPLERCTGRSASLLRAFCSS